MAKISALTSGAPAVNATDYVVIARSGANYKLSLTELKAIAAITSGSIAGITDLAVADGGTGASSAINAAKNLGVPYTLLSSGIPFIHVSSGSMGNNGALSGVTALGQTYAKGAYVYLPANAIQAGSSAGWYFAIFSSTTAATVYQETYTSGSPSIPASPTAWVSTGPGAYTGDTTVRTALDITLPAGAMGPNGNLRIRCVNTATNNANAKTNFIVKLGGAGGTNHLSSTGVSTLGSTGEAVIHNVGAQDAQSSQTTVVGTSGAMIRSTIDTSAATTIVIQHGKTGNATDNTVLENYSIVLTYGA